MECFIQDLDYFIGTMNTDPRMPTYKHPIYENVRGRGAREVRFVSHSNDPAGDHWQDKQL